MRILMLGNSFTSAQGLPERLGRLLGAEVVAHTRGGARLAEQLNPKTKLGARTAEALAEGGWDYVVMQEMSSAPVRTPERFLEAVAALSARARACGAVPVLYETWAYEEESARLAKAGIGYAEMHAELSGAYERAARESGTRSSPRGSSPRRYGNTPTRRGLARAPKMRQGAVRVGDFGILAHFLRFCGKIRPGKGRISSMREEKPRSHMKAPLGFSRRNEKNAPKSRNHRRNVPESAEGSDFPCRTSAMTS